MLPPLWRQRFRSGPLSPVDDTWLVCHHQIEVLCSSLHLNARFQTAKKKVRQ